MCGWDFLKKSAEVALLLQPVLVTFAVAPMDPVTRYHYLQVRHVEPFG